MWEQFDEYMIYNEQLKVSVYWTTYGEKDQYFLAKSYEFEEDFLEEIEFTDIVLVNEEITETNTKEELIAKARGMVE